ATAPSAIRSAGPNDASVSSIGMPPMCAQGRFMAPRSARAKADRRCGAWDRCVAGAHRDRRRSSWEDLGGAVATLQAHLRRPWGAPGAVMKVDEEIRVDLHPTLR